MKALKYNITLYYVSAEIS